jgi:outer membrane murein-binding lipoprotein Lpp
MPWWTWIAVGFFAAVLVAAAIVAAVAFRSMKALQAVGMQLTTAVDELNAKAIELERKSVRASRQVEVAEPHFDHLKTTLDRFSVLTWALGDVAKTVGELRSTLLVRK